MRRRKKRGACEVEARMKLGGRQKNFRSVTSPLLFPASSCSSLSSPRLLPTRPFHLSVRKIPLQLNNKLLPSPLFPSPPFHPLPLLYTHSIIWETRLREMSGVRAIIIITSFRRTVNYSAPYRKHTFKS